MTSYYYKSILWNYETQWGKFGEYIELKQNSVWKVESDFIGIENF